MAPQLTHDDIQELLGAFAIDAVDADEAEAIEDHLAHCPRCRAEVAEHREAATMLAFSGADAPDGIWSRIASSLEEAPPPLRLPQPIPLRRRRLVVPSMFAAAAAVAVIALLGIQVAQQGERIDELSAVFDLRGLDQAAAAAAIAPNARTARLVSDDGTHYVDAVVLPNGQGYLVTADLPRLDPDETYQLWGVMGAQTVSLGVLGDDPATAPFRAAGPLSALAITAEHGGGVVASTNAPIVSGLLSG